MRLVLWTFIAIASLLFCLTVYNLIQANRSSLPDIGLIDDLHDFQKDTQTPGFKELMDLYVAKIKAYKSKAEKHHSRWLLVSFIVTALTAASTLVSSIKAAKPGDTVDKRSMILIAVFAFLATLGNWGALQLNESRNGAVQKMGLISDHRNKFIVEFQKASTDTQRAELISNFKYQLETM